MELIIRIKFQFHYGSIKILDGFAIYLRINMFQFHYGSIKIGSASMPQSVQFPFQFHYGSIKIVSAQLVTSRQACFNSTMVRLKLIWIGEEEPPIYVSIPLWFD